ncbi:MAG: serine hydrolase [Candidatus Dormibacter sp.]
MRATPALASIVVVGLALTILANNAEAKAPNHVSLPIAPTGISSTAASGGKAIVDGVNALARWSSANYLDSVVQQLVTASGANVGVTLVDLGGSDPTTWDVDGSAVFTAASTYKLAALMMEAENISAGKTDPNGLVCFEPDDYEAGWFDDYSPGLCFTRNELAWRAGITSDNTAGHMLVRDLGGPAALNAWASSVGASDSDFFDGNTTTSDDLAALWVAESEGRLGGSLAQAWLYPLLTDTATESGIPAGVGSGVVVAHKTGTLDTVANDAALVESGPNGPYVITVMTDGLAGAAGWQLIAAISASVWEYESLRTR